MWRIPNCVVLLITIHLHKAKIENRHKTFDLLMMKCKVKFKVKSKLPFKSLGLVN